MPSDLEYSAVRSTKYLKIIKSLFRATETYTQTHRHAIRRKIYIISQKIRQAQQKDSTPQGSVPSKIRERRLWKERKLSLKNPQ